MKKFLLIFSVFLLFCFVLSCNQTEMDSEGTQSPSEKLASNFDKEIGVITTSSQEAYELYRQGREIFYKNQMSQSIPLFEEAISLDPDFAMAYRSLASAHRNIGGAVNVEKAKNYLAKALELGDKVTPKEKMIIQGDLYSFENNYEKAIEIFEELNESYPENRVTWSKWFGFLYAQLSEWDEIIKYSEIVRENRDGMIFDYERLGNAYCAKGMYDEARAVYQDYVDNIFEAPSMLRNISFTYVLEGNYDDALAAADKAIALEPQRYSKASIYHLQGDFEAAEREYKSWQDIDTIAAKINSRRWLEFLYRSLGQYKKAEEEIRAALKLAEENNLIGWKRTLSNILAEYDFDAGNLDSILEKAEFIWDSAVKSELPSWQINALWWKIRVRLERNDIEGALTLAEEVKRIADETPSRIDNRWYLDDLGLVALKRENYPEAIEYFNQVFDLQGGQRSWLDPHGYILSHLASAYFLNGDMEMAKKKYEEILALTTGRLQSGDIYAKSFYNLGIIHEAQGNESKAIEQYEKFLDFWRDADLGLPEVEDAKTRLAGLKNL